MHRFTNLIKEMLVAGFPCQDIANSGNRLGFDGNRSCLIFEVVRLAVAAGISFLFLENVAGLLSARMWCIMAKILDCLNTNGFLVVYRCVRARNAGSPQDRPRVFFLAFKTVASLDRLHKLVGDYSVKDVNRDIEGQWNPANNVAVKRRLLTTQSTDNFERLCMLGNTVAYWLGISL